MPRHQPFTQLCQLTARPATRVAADLHAHTTHSDGTETPARVLDRARRAGLRALAVTDHDTLSGYREATVLPAPAADGWPALELVPGVEITCSFRNRELHLLGYWVDADDQALNAALDRLRDHRRGRYAAMACRLRELGVAVPDDGDGSPGRPQLARALVAAGKATSVRDAFARWLRDGGPVAVPKLRLPVAEAVALVRGAGGVAAWAHPRAEDAADGLAELAGLGLHAVEVDHPSIGPAASERLRGWAGELGLAAAGGSDWHGPAKDAAPLGSRGPDADAFAALKRLARPGVPA